MRPAAAAILVAYAAAAGACAGWQATQAAGRRDQERARLWSRVSALEERLRKPEEVPAP